MTEKKLQILVDELPEVYQVIYGHPEWDGAAARDCRSRLALIEDACQQLSTHLRRPLKILDLGCAQGFFSLSLASNGAIVTGVDFQAENIAVCSALAEENPGLQLRFVRDRIEDFVERIKPREYDVVLGLSVFHHLIFLHGVEHVKRLLMTLMNAINLGVFEFALKEEPLYWSGAQPDDPQDLIDGCAFYHQISSHETHLSHVRRPIYLVSNRTLLLKSFCGEFDRWRNYPYAGAGEAHNASRRYYWGSGFFGKIFDYTSVRKSFPPEVGSRNRSELKAEGKFLQKPPEGFQAPRVLAFGETTQQGWIVTSVINGDLLSDMIDNCKPVDVDSVLSDVLQQLIILENSGLYHDDIRLWNVMYDCEVQHFTLIDYGSIGKEANDCVWPYNIFQAFVIFVHELLMLDVFKVGKARPPLLSPYHLPSPYAGWLYAFWQKPVFEWRFSLLAELFEQRISLPQPDTKEHGAEAWLRAFELNVLERLRHESDMRDRIDMLSRDRSRMLESLSQTEERLLAQSGVIEAIDERVRLLTVRGESYEERVQALTERGESNEERLRLLSGQCMDYEETLEAVYRSRSWRMTAPYRYLGLQFVLLRQCGFKQRFKQFFKRFFKWTVRLANRHPAMKSLAFRILRFSGLYRYVHQIHRRILPVEKTPTDTTDYFQGQIFDQLADRRLLPRVVNDLFDKLS